MSDASRTDGTAQATVPDAASVFEALLSAEDSGEDTESRETLPEREPKKAAPESEAEGETEQPADEDVAEESEEETESEPETPPKYRVKVDGAEEEVTLDELLKGYSRTADYTRKAQKLAEQRKSLEAELPAVQQERAEYARKLTELHDTLKALTPEEPDWAKAQQELPPADFAALWASWAQHKEKLNEIDAQRKQAVEKVQEDRRKAMAAHAEQEKSKLLERIPAWKDPAVAKAESAKVREFALEQGYTDEDLNAITDHRAIAILRDAMLHREAQKQKPSVQQKIEKVKAAPPGSPATNKQPVSDVTRAKQRLAKTGKVSDLAGVFETMLDD